ncbi:hypothetical protein [Microbacterium sp.]|uniref:hypothetical protein n=1 Tax=Microbacterium sp. TaxID=51671 RepID=UPI0039E5FC8B
MQRVSLLVPVAALIALVLSGCAGDKTDTSSADAWKSSPLNAYLSAVWGGDLSEEEQARTLAEQQKKVEELVATCMAEEGFDYTPVDYSDQFSTGSAEEWDPDSREWVAQYGYGAVNSPGKEEAEQAVEEVTDPNQEYVESLSESEQAAYSEALYGPPPSEEELGEDGAIEWNWETAGCQGAAQHEVNAVQDIWSDDEFADLRQAMEKLWEDVENDPARAELDAEWASCMADAGYDGFTKQQDAAQSIYDALNELNAEAPQPAEGASVEEIDAQWKAYEDELEKKSEPIAEREVKLALADLDCREKTDYSAKQLELQFAAEEQFIADHKAELEAFKAAAEQNS